MAAKPLVKTNPYLKDPEKRRIQFITTVSSSTAIEGVYATVAQAITEAKNVQQLSQI